MIGEFRSSWVGKLWVLPNRSVLVSEVFAEHLIYFGLFGVSGFWAGVTWCRMYRCRAWTQKFDALFRNADAPEKAKRNRPQFQEHISEWFTKSLVLRGYCHSLR